MFYVISGQADSMTPGQGDLATRKLAAMLRLHGLSPQHAVGVFEGKSECSLIVPVSTLAHHSIVLNLAREHKQRYVLSVDDLHIATLLPCNPDLMGEELGDWSCFGNEMPPGDYTYINGLYYVCG